MDMKPNTISSWISLTFTGAAAVLFILGIVLWLLSLFGVDVLLSYKPGRLIEFAAMFLLPVVVVLLRQIREELRKLE